MRPRKLILLVTLLSILLSVMLVGCDTQAEKVSQNVSQEADNFNVIRRLTVLDTRTDTAMFELIAAFSIEVDHSDNQLEVTCETGANQYNKHFIGLNRDTVYVVEDISGASVSKYHYEINFQPEAIVPVTLTSKD
jgi:hypothetical protein